MMIIIISHLRSPYNKWMILCGFFCIDFISGFKSRFFFLFFFLYIWHTSWKLSSNVYLVVVMLVKNLFEIFQFLVEKLVCWAMKYVRFARVLRVPLFQLTAWLRRVALSSCRSLECLLRVLSFALFIVIYLALE